MQERIIDIIVYLLAEFQQDQPRETYIDLSRELLSRGYTENEINIAFSWIFNHLQGEPYQQNHEVQYTDNSVRILHDLEKLVVSAEGYGYVLQLLHLGILNDNDVELIIERALSLGTTNVTVADIKAVVASLIFGSESTNSFNGFFFHEGTNTIH